MSKKYLHFKILLRPYTTALAKYGRRRYIAKANDSTEQIYIRKSRRFQRFCFPSFNSIYFNKEKEKNTNCLSFFRHCCQPKKENRISEKPPKSLHTKYNNKKRFEARSHSQLDDSSSNHINFQGGRIGRNKKQN